MKTEFKPGDRIKIIASGCNNSSVPEYQLPKCLRESDTIHIVARVETKGNYRGYSIDSYTLILETGQPIWANHCELVKEEIINNYQIY